MGLKVYTVNNTLQQKTLEDVNGSVLTRNYVLEYSTQAYIDEQGYEQYKYIQKAFNTNNKLETLCRYIYADGVDCIPSEYFVVYSNNKFLLLNWNTNVITELNYDYINEVHNYIFGLMENN